MFDRSWCAFDKVTQRWRRQRARDDARGESQYVITAIKMAAMAMAATTMAAIGKCGDGDGGDGDGGDADGGDYDGGDSTLKK